MTTIIEDKTMGYRGTDGRSVNVYYRLCERRGKFGCSRVYDIICRSDVVSETICEGITDDLTLARRIFCVLTDNIVLPEHIEDVADDLIYELM